MSTPIKVEPWDIYRGDDHTRTFRFSDDTGAMDLTGWDFRAQWRPTADAEKALELDIDISSADEGLITVTVTSAQSRRMGGPGVWDLQGEAESGTRTWVDSTTTYRKDKTR